MFNKFLFTGLICLTQMAQAFSSIEYFEGACVTCGRAKADPVPPGTSYTINNIFVQPQSLSEGNRVNLTFDVSNVTPSDLIVPANPGKTDTFILQQDGIIQIDLNFQYRGCTNPGLAALLQVYFNATPANSSNATTIAHGTTTIPGHFDTDCSTCSNVQSDLPVKQQNRVIYTGHKGDQITFQVFFDVRSDLFCSSGLTFAAIPNSSVLKFTLTSQCPQNP